MYSSCITHILYVLISSIPFPLPPAHGNYHSILCFSDFWLFSIHHVGRIIQCWSPVPGLFHLAHCLQALSKLLQMPDSFSFWRLESIPFHMAIIFHVCTILSLPIHPPVDIWDVFISWLLGIVLQWYGNANIYLRSWFQFFWINTPK